MNIEAIQTYILNYVNHFTMYDYVAFAWLILTFFITLLLAIILAKRSVLLSILTLLFSLVFLCVGPFVLKNVLDDLLRPSEVKVDTYKKLHFTDVLIINGKVENKSKSDFSICSLQASVYKQSKTQLKQLLDKLKPLRKKTIILESPIKSNDFEDFKIIFYNFDYPDDINVSVKSECY